MRCGSGSNAFQRSKLIWLNPSYIHSHRPYSYWGCIVLRQGALQACSNGRINVYFDSISILTFAARLGLKSTQTPAQAQSEPIAYVVVSSQAETSPRAQYGFNDRIGVEFGSCRRIIFTNFNNQPSTYVGPYGLPNRPTPAPAFYYICHVKKYYK